MESAYGESRSQKEASLAAPTKGPGRPKPLPTVVQRRLLPLVLNRAWQMTLELDALP